jgi:hypothetical protein
MACRRPVGKTYSWLEGGLARYGARQTVEGGARGGVAGVVVMGRLVSLYSQPSACVGNGRWVYGGDEVAGSRGAGGRGGATIGQRDAKCREEQQQQQQKDC